VSADPHGSRSERVAIFGGAFDPFHFGHLSAIRHLLASHHVDRVLVVPSGDRPDKMHLSGATDRYEMARRGVAARFGSDPRVTVSDLQVSGRVGYGTIDLVKHFQHDPSRRALIVIGQELLGDLDRWKEAESLKQRATFLVMQRPGTEKPHVPPGWNVHVLEPFPDGGIDVSSTELREKIRRGESVERLIPSEVLAYCKERRLYSLIDG
jgi:nicotinate-nucleotide adenylyltransferase